MMNALRNLSTLPHEVIYAMGISFVLGSLCTILLLCLLDMVRVIQQNAAADFSQGEME